jgi:hypothetical protein
MTRYDYPPEQIEALECPSCGRHTLSYWQDPYGDGAQCTSMDCLELFDADELTTEHPPHSSPGGSAEEAGPNSLPASSALGSWLEGLAATPMSLEVIERNRVPDTAKVNEEWRDFLREKGKEI